MDGGMLRLFREETSDFLHRYRVNENRAVHRSRIDVSADTYQRLVDRFDQRFLLEHEQFALLAAARADRLLLALLTRRIGPGTGFAIPGLGYFPDPPLAAGGAGSGGGSPTLARLRARVRAVRGEAFLAERRRALLESLRRLAPVADAAAPRLSERAAPPADYSFAERWGDLAAGLRVLAVLQAAPPLREGTFFAPGTDEFRVTPAESEQLRAYANSLEAELVDLAASQRPDWAWPFALGMARLVAMGESIASGHWVVLDAFPADAEVRPGDRLGAGRRIARGRLAAARSQLRAARAAWVGAPADERRYAGVESAIDRALEWQRGLVSGSDVRLAPQRVPSTPARVSVAAAPGPVPAALERAYRQALEREGALEAELRRLYGYNLLTRNCVSEIFHNVDLAFATGASPGSDADRSDRQARSESRERLGGYVAVRGTPAVIPWVSRRAVNAAYRVADTDDMPSHRSVRLAEMYRRENPLVVWLRESNTLTSTLYQRNPDDSAFIFFTDGAALPRPLFGAVNLVAGLSEGVLGLLRLPLDRGRMLWSGVRGALVSVPELFFCNIRKGTYAIAPADPPP